MKIPEPAPNIEFDDPGELAYILPLFKLQEARSLLSQANQYYLYWDKFKHKKMPPNVRPEHAWFLLKLERRAQFKFVPLTDKKNRQFCFWLPNSINEKLHYIDSFAGGQITADHPVFNSKTREQYLIRSLMEEAISSSLLEGAATTRQKAKAMLVSGKRPKTYADKMVLNNYRTIHFLRELKNETLSIELIKKIHESVSLDTLEEDAGKFRKDADDVKVTDETGQVLFVPPVEKEIIDRLQALVDFANAKERSGEFIHPVIKAILIHFFLGYIHPFVDGNGRTARALFYWYLLKKNYWLFEFISISSVIRKAPAQYARAYLYSEKDDQDLTYFIYYNLRVIQNGLKELNGYLNKKQVEIKKISNSLRKHPKLNFRQYALLQHALNHPGHFYSIREHEIMSKITYETARTDLLGLAKLNIMEKIKKGPVFYFILNDNLQNEWKLDSSKN